MAVNAAELRDGLAVILGTAPPEPDGDAFLFFKQWLAERNLGLVPIADARAFAWPGHWLARVRTADGDHVVVMFGSPSGPLHDPSGALGSGGTIEEGWLVARLDVHLPIDEPYAGNGVAAGGSVVGILTAPDAEVPLARVERATAIAGRGLDGDRYAFGRGTFSGPGRGYELTLVEAEVLDSIGLPWEEARRNLVTTGIELNALVGRRFTVGAVQCVGRRLAEPCAHLERLARPGLLRPLVHRGGLRADILAGGPIAIGDRVALTEP
ncbi:MAG TPA: MOSC domain-containing protein [Gaiellaceae bacterium]|nr:MOSC domain-containing protein [Gaiellaceae bacterium]